MWGEKEGIIEKKKRRAWHSAIGKGQLAGQEDVNSSFVDVPNADGTYQAACTCERKRVPAGEWCAHGHHIHGSLQSNAARCAHQA